MVKTVSTYMQAKNCFIDYQSVISKLSETFNSDSAENFRDSTRFWNFKQLTSEIAISNFITIQNCGVLLCWKQLHKNSFKVNKSLKIIIQNRVKDLKTEVKLISLKADGRPKTRGRRKTSVNFCYKGSRLPVGMNVNFKYSKVLLMKTWIYFRFTMDYQFKNVHRFMFVQ